MTDHRLQNGLPRVQAGPGSRLPRLVELAGFLFGRDYDAAEQNAILVSVCDTGSLETAAERGHLDPEDYEVAERVFSYSQPDVPQDDPAWGPPIGQPGTELWTTEPPAAPGTVQAPLKLQPRPDWRNWRLALDSGEIPPISGGAPEVAEPDVFERLARLAQKNLELWAQLDAIPDDWRLYYYPW